MTRILLVSPTFHGYWRAVAASFEERGHVVTTCRYDEVSGAAAKARHKIRHELPEKLGHRSRGAGSAHATRIAMSAFRDTRPDVVVIIKGDVLNDDFWTELGNTPRVLWLYDELRRTEWARRSLDGIGPICSYSRLDTQSLTDHGLEAHHLPLAYDHRLQPRPRAERSAEIVFIGARYPNREQTLTTLRAHGIRTTAYGRDWSHHWWDRLRTLDPRRPDVNAGRELDRRAAYDVMSSASAALNIHGDQDGFTMRTFEACGVGGVQLIDRNDLQGLYDDGVELASYSSSEELVEHCRRAKRDTAWAQSLRSAGRVRTLATHTFDHRAVILESAFGT